MHPELQQVADAEVNRQLRSVWRPRSAEKFRNWMSRMEQHPQHPSGPNTTQSNQKPHPRFGQNSKAFTAVLAQLGSQILG